MRNAWRVAGATLLIFVFVVSFAVLVQPGAQAAKKDYECCRYPVKDPTGVRIAFGVWFDGECHCLVMWPSQNPNRCTLRCPPPL